MSQAVNLEDAHLELGRLVGVLQHFTEGASRPEHAYYQAALQCLLDAQEDIAPSLAMPKVKTARLASRLARRR